MGSLSPVTSVPPDDPRVRYQKLERAYYDLVTEMERLEREGKLLRHRLQEVVDKQKMKQILEHLVSERD